VKRLTATRANEEHPSWSPDSRFLVYDSNKYGNYDIYIMSIYGGEPRRITTSKAKEIMPAWSNRLQQP
jgi:Tol biopolymer transport system component